MHYIKKGNNKKISTFRLRLYFIFSLLILIAIFLLYLIIYSPIFQIKKIEVKNNKDITNKELLASIASVMQNKLLINYIGSSNILVWPSGELSLPNSLIANVNIDKDWINRSIEITVKERTRYAIWCFNEGRECYWFDKNGIIFEKSPLAEDGLITVVYDSKINSDIVLGKKISEERFIKNILEILDGLQNTDEIQISKILFDNAVDEMIINTFSGPKILFSIRFSPIDGINVLKHLISSNQYANLTNVDLRIENKAFIK